MFQKLNAAYNFLMNSEDNDAEDEEDEYSGSGFFDEDDDITAIFFEFMYMPTLSRVLKVALLTVLTSCGLQTCTHLPCSRHRAPLGYATRSEVPAGWGGRHMWLEHALLKLSRARELWK